MKNLLAMVLVALLAACGGGEAPAPTATVPLPFRQASPVSGDTEIALHLYQALYGKAPGNPQLSTFKSQISTNGAAAWANSMAASFNNLSNVAFATRVLNNISITETSLAATATFGTPKQAYEGLLGGFVDYLNLVGLANRGVVAAQLTKIISNLEVDTQFGVYGPAAISLNRQITVNSTYSADPQNVVDGVVPPATANAGATQNVVAGTVVTLDGSASAGEFGKTLTFLWTLTSRPAGSTAVLTNATSAKPTFTADAAGTYVASLVVNDGKVSSTAVTVSVTATVANPPPVASFGTVAITGNAVGIAGALVPSTFSPTSQGSHPTSIVSWSQPVSGTAWYVTLNGDVITSTAGFGSWQRQAVLSGVESLGVAFDLPNGRITFTNVTLPAFAVGQTGNLILNGTLNVPAAVGTNVTISGTGTNAAGSGLDAPVAAKTTTVIGSTTKNLYTWKGGKGVSIEVEDYSNGTKTVKLANAAGPSWRSLSPGVTVSVNSGAKTVTFNNVALNGVSPTTTTITLNGTLSLP